jgi:hypothetical protein
MVAIKSNYPDKIPLFTLIYKYLTLVFGDKALQASLPPICNALKLIFN